MRDVAGPALLAAVVAGSVLGRELWPYRHDEQLAGAAALPPSWQHPMGTSALGHDVLAQVLQGTVRTLQVAGTVAVLATLAGTAIGVVAGYSGGWVDAVLMGLVDLVLSLPALALLVVLAARVSTHRWLPVALVLSALLWTGCARLVRGAALVVREHDYVAAARALGASRARILRRHVLPAVLPVVLASAVVTASVAVLAETALSFLGFGVAPPDVSLGRLVQAADRYSAPWQFAFPGLAILVVVATLHVVADGIRAALDPRSGTAGRRSATERRLPTRRWGGHSDGGVTMTAPSNAVRGPVAGS
jgi:peptide/nickel transport system permease protein